MTASQPPPRREPEEKAEPRVTPESGAPWTESELAVHRRVAAGYPVENLLRELPGDHVRKWLATLDAARAANAELQAEAVRAHRELEALNADLRAEQEKDIVRLEAANAEMRRALEGAVQSLETASKWAVGRGDELADRLSELREWTSVRAREARAALRAAEKATEAREEKP